jgi:hypothetical protein
MRASVAECEAMLVEDLNEAGRAVKRMVNVPLSPSQFDSLVSFVFNLGSGNFQKSTLLKKLNSGKYDEIPEQIMRWNKARVDGVLQPLRGLTRRRSAEAALFAIDAPLADADGDLMPQKPEQQAPKSLKKSKTMAGAGVAGVGTIGSVIGDAATNIEGLIAYSDSIKLIFIGLTIAGIALVTYSRIKDNKEGVH